MNLRITRAGGLSILALVLALALGLVLGGCGRKKQPAVTRIWVGPNSGCVDALPNPTIGTHGCWGVNDAGQIGDGTTTSRPFVTALARTEGKLTDLSIGERHACAVFDEKKAYCWGDGARGQLGAGTTPSSQPVPTGDPTDKPGVSVRVGGAHTCVRFGDRDRLRCFGADDEGQLGASPTVAWERGAEVRAFALGEAHTCVAFSGPVSPNSAEKEPHVLCRGRASAAPAEPILRGVPVRDIGAGQDFTCALLEDRTVRCWGKNDAGQLGDGTTNDSLAPVTVLDLQGIDQIGVGARHACAKLANGTIACWGDNAVHQLSDGTTQRRARPAVVVGLVQARQLVVSGNSSCVLLDGGFVRCWGPNEGSQLGDGSTTDHSVPMPPKFR